MAALPNLKALIAAQKAQSAQSPEREEVRDVGATVSETAQLNFGKMLPNGRNDMGQPINIKETKHVQIEEDSIEQSGNEGIQETVHNLQVDARPQTGSRLQIRFAIGSALAQPQPAQKEPAAVEPDGKVLENGNGENSPQVSGGFRLNLGKAQTPSLQHLVGLAAKIKHAKPSVVLDIVEQEIEKRAPAHIETVQAPVLSLKGLLQKQHTAFEQQFGVKEEHVESCGVLGAHSTAADTPKEMIKDASQDAALELMQCEQFVCLIGAAGTGKTTTLRRYLEMLMESMETIRIEDGTDEHGETNYRYILPIVFCAFTGRAVEQMKRALPAEFHANCGTIHGDKVLNYVPEYYEEMDVASGGFRTKMRFVPTFCEWKKLPYLYYVIDETGMLSVELWNTLHKAMLPEAKVIMVGDINQLPPVYGRSILGYAMTKWPVAELTTIHRQAADNPIIANAHKILDGQPPIAVRGRFDMNDLKDKGSLATQTHFISVIKKLHRDGEFNEFNDGVIVPQNVGSIGQLQLNELLVTYFNAETGPHNKRHLIKTGIAMCSYAVGDKIMMLANDKDKNLTNGQIGRITSININGAYKNASATVTHADLQGFKNVTVDDNEFQMDDIMEVVEDDAESENNKNQRQASHIVTAEFDGREVSFSTAGEFRKIAHAYVITCHKSQGGEYPVVIILVHSANNKLLSREWLYTAVTRARVRIVLVYNQRGLMQAVKRQHIKGRTLKEKIASFIEFSKESQAKVGEDYIEPDLP